MIPVGVLVPGAVAEVIRKAPLTPEKIAFAWRMAVGPALSKATSVRLDDEGTLHVTAETEEWRAAAQRSTSLVNNRLAALLGDGVVQRLTFVNSEATIRRQT